MRDKVQIFLGAAALIALLLVLRSLPLSQWLPALRQGVEQAGW